MSKFYYFALGLNLL